MPNTASSVNVDFNAAYVGERKDIIALIRRAPATVLDVGCATGSTGRRLMECFGCQVTGVEFDPNMAAVARNTLHRVHVADLNKTTLREVASGQTYDLILFGDILEHLIDPWATLADARALLNANGTIVTSFPNVGHFSTLLSLLVFRRWPYRERGIHDRTHLRFFTRKNLLELYAAAGLSVVEEQRKLRLIESPSALNRYAGWLDFFPFRSYLTFQYLHVLKAAGALE